MMVVYGNHGSYKYSSIKFNYFSVNFPHHILTFPGVALRSETPRRLQRYQIAAGVKLQKGGLGVSPLKNLRRFCAFWCNKKYKFIKLWDLINIRLNLKIINDLLYRSGLNAGCDWWWAARWAGGCVRGPWRETWAVPCTHASPAASVRYSARSAAS